MDILFDSFETFWVLALLFLAATFIATKGSISSKGCYSGMACFLPEFFRNFLQTINVSLMCEIEVIFFLNSMIST